MAYVDRDVDNGTTYSYAVSALGATSAGARSQPASATPHAPPATPRDLRCTVGDRRVVLNWTAVAAAGDYRVKRGANLRWPVRGLGRIARGADLHGRQRDQWGNLCLCRFLRKRRLGKP